MRQVTDRMAPPTEPATYRYAYSDLLDYAARLGAAAGLSYDRAHVQSEMLLESDLMGHTTHGLHLLPSLLGEIESGGMRTSGEPVTLADHPAALHWDGQFLPGTWLMVRAIEAARAKLPQNPVVTAVVRQCHHIAGLVAYLRQATEVGLAILIVHSDPSSKTVAAHGGIDRQITPNPLAFGYPAAGGPVLIDISTSTTANGWVRRWMAEGRKLPGKWIVDDAGRLSDDPNALLGDPPGALLPLGGAELGYKGFALGLLVEALTSGLTGYGRADAATGYGGTVTLMLFDPSGFGGSNAFLRETGFLADSVRRSRARPHAEPPRMPGERALALRAHQLGVGVLLYPSIMPALAPWTDKLGVPAPTPIP
jgi:LDH2 family malate/lactate/ureidoglycolate dehydrogenase